MEMPRHSEIVDPEFYYTVCKTMSVNIIHTFYMFSILLVYSKTP